MTREEKDSFLAKLKQLCNEHNADFSYVKTEDIWIGWFEDDETVAPKSVTDRSGWLSAIQKRHRTA